MTAARAATSHGIRGHRAVAASLVAGTVALIGAAASLGAQAPAAEPLLDSILARWQRPGLRVNALIRAFGDYQPDRVARGTNGFQVFEARLGIAGELDGGWRYQLQTGVTRSPALLDVRVGKRFSPSLLVDIGRFKADFSREWILAISDADFAGRSSVALALAPSRQMGVQARKTLNDGRVELAAGAYNGNATHTGNDNNDLMLVGRIGTWLVKPSRGVQGGWEVAINGATSRDADAPIGNIVPSYAGRRLVYGAETWRRGERWMFGAEYIRAELDSASGTRIVPEGWQGTVGYSLDADDQLLLRWDVLRADGLVRDVDDLVLGWNHWPRRTTQLQLNWFVPLRDHAVDRHRVVLSVQFII